MIGHITLLKFLNYIENCIIYMLKSVKIITLFKYQITEFDSKII